MSDIYLWVFLGVLVVMALFVDLKVFARNHEPRFKESVAWSVGWLALGLAVAVLIYFDKGGEAATNYTTVYLIERSLSLDNLFVFLMLFGYFAVPSASRPKLLFLGIVLALLLRGVAILGGAALIEQFHWVLYLLGATLLVIAIKMFKDDHDHKDPGDTLPVKAMQKLFPVDTEDRSGRYLVIKDGQRYITPLALALVAIVFADIIFAIDSIPAAFAITTDSAVIWAANAFALMGLRALFVLIEQLVKKFRYLDETIAIVLGFVAIKILIEIWHVKISAVASLLVIVVLFAGGALLSVWADRREQAERQKG